MTMLLFELAKFLQPLLKVLTRLCAWDDGHRILVVVVIVWAADEGAGGSDGGLSCGRVNTISGAGGGRVHRGRRRCSKDGVAGVSGMAV